MSSKGADARPILVKCMGMGCLICKGTSMWATWRSERTSSKTWQVSREPRFKSSSINSIKWASSSLWRWHQVRRWSQSQRCDWWRNTMAPQRWIRQQTLSLITASASQPWWISTVSLTWSRVLRSWWVAKALLIMAAWRKEYATGAKVGRLINCLAYRCTIHESLVRQAWTRLFYLRK